MDIKLLEKLFYCWSFIVYTEAVVIVFSDTRIRIVGFMLSSVLMDVLLTLACGRWKDLLIKEKSKMSAMIVARMLVFTKCQLCLVFLLRGNPWILAPFFIVSFKERMLEFLRPTLGQISNFIT